MIKEWKNARATRSRQRHQTILAQLDNQGACTYQQLAAALEVSTMTVRRDVNELARRGGVIKTLGGAQKAHAPLQMYETALNLRLSVQRHEKRRIALRAVELIGSQHTIFIDGSTTCLELARRLAQERQGLTIVTNSALACLELGRGGGNLVVGIGGQYDAQSLSFIGPQSEDWAQSLFVDLAFVSTKGFLPAEGTFESSVGTFHIKQIIARQCHELVLLVDHSKFGQRALSKVLDISQIHTVVTDEQTPAADLAELESRGRKVLVARPDPAPALERQHGA